MWFCGSNIFVVALTCHRSCFQYFGTLECWDLVGMVLLPMFFTALADVDDVVAGGFSVRIDQIFTALKWATLPLRWPHVVA